MRGRSRRRVQNREADKRLRRVLARTNGGSLLSHRSADVAPCLDAYMCDRRQVRHPTDSTSASATGGDQVLSPRCCLEIGRIEQASLDCFRRSHQKSHSPRGAFYDVDCVFRNGLFLRYRWGAVLRWRPPANNVVSYISIK